MAYIKSPIHYMGCKYDLLPMMLEQFPDKSEIDTFIDLFGGSGTVSLNVDYNKIIYNELNENMCKLLQMLKDTKPEELIKHIQDRIIQFDLNPVGTDVRGKDVDMAVRNKYNDRYLKFRAFYNKSDRDIKDLFLLSFYSFCNLMRFNSKNEFNMPYGNRCYLTDNDTELIYQTHKVLNSKYIYIYNNNCFELLKEITKNDNQFIYLDPPYSNSTAIYNESRAFGGWSIKDDEKLFNELDRLSNLGIKWAYSNVLSIKGRNNNHIEEWANKNNYTIIEFENKDYSSLGKGKANAREVMIINYEQRVKQYSIFDYEEVK